MAKKQLNVLIDSETRAEIGAIRRRFKLNSDAQAVTYAVHTLAGGKTTADIESDIIVDPGAPPHAIINIPYGLETCRACKSPIINDICKCIVKELKQEADPQ